jgi:hypothetical protein
MTASIDEERSTVIPEYDPEAFARDSEMRQRAVLMPAGGPTVDEARKLMADGGHEQALFLLSRLLEGVPLHAEATALAAECRMKIERECLATVGSEAAVLVAAVSPAELRTFALDNVSGFLLSLMDGATSVEDILDVSTLPRLMVLRHLRNLLDRGIVAAASRRRPR